MQYQLTASIVLYKNDEFVKKTIKSFLNSSLQVKLFLVDNSPTDELKILLEEFLNDARVEYIFNNNNVGFGAGHNIAIKKIIDVSPYHLVLNPDVVFDAAILSKLIDYMKLHNDVGIIAPKVLDEAGSLQYLSKLLPTPLDFFIIRFMPFAFRRKQAHFKLKQSHYDKLMNVPFLSGCFMIFNTAALKKTGLFDEKIFMYTEDIDITRRMINASYKTIFYPFVFIYHHHQRKSFADFNVFKIYLKSALYYFNKWGWFFDKERSKINQLTLAQLKPE
jgi:GT2 family glycosyltransferase